MIKVLAYFLLYVALNCQMSVEQGMNGAAIPPPLLLQPPPPPPSQPPPPPPSPPPPPPLPQLPSEEVDAVNKLLQLLSTFSSLRATYFSSLSCHYIRFRPAITCNCNLEGNTCRVVAIDLSGLGLSGFIPPEIGNLTHLESLDLRLNSLMGSIPNSFVKLSRLSELNLCVNMLEGPLPNFLGEMKSLRSLYLCSNLFNESIPPEFGNLPELEYLSLYNNSLLGKLPDELGRISTLKGLYLSDNQLERKLPDSLGNLAYLEDMYLYDNQFEGQLPDSLGKLPRLRDMYLMNNRFDGELPQSFQNLKSLKGFNIQGNGFNKSIPEFIFEWPNLQKLILMGNNFEGYLPKKISGLPNLTYLAINDLPGRGTDVPFPDIHNMESLAVLTLRNCSLTGPIPEYIWNFRKLVYLDLSFNNLNGTIPAELNLQFEPQCVFLRSNKLNGTVPGWLTSLNSTYVDVSENSFNATLTNHDIPSNLNLFQCCSDSQYPDLNWQEAGYSCANGTPIHDHLYINCGGNATSVDGHDYQADLQSYGGSTFFLSTDKTWAYSSLGTFLDADKNNYILDKACNISNTDTSLYLNARIAPISLKYYGFCLKNDNYTVRLHFAEIGWDTNRASTIWKRVFDVEIQGGQHYLRNFSIVNEAGDVNKVVTRDFNVSVNDSRLEIHLYWSGKGSTLNPTKYYGPSISAITVFPEPRKPPKRIPPGGIAGIVGSIIGFGILILAISWAVGWIGRKKLKDGVELYPGGKYDFSELKAATKNFDTAKQIGGVGNVYKGEIDGIDIAVKQLSAQSRERVQQFITAIGTISALKHPNLATLMGFCTEQKQLLLVYKYMENISLQHALFGPEEVKSKLNWETRFKICLAVAKGLAYLHESELKVIHCNIKPANILLDKDFAVKISDFEYSQFHDSQVDAQLNKDETTLGSLPKAKMTKHMAPELIQGIPLTPKADVYSFGIVTLEIVSGQEIYTMGPKDSKYLLNTALTYQKEGNLIALVDSSLQSIYKYNQALTMLHLAMQCVSPGYDVRPSMSDVVKILEGNKKLDISSTSAPPVSSDSVASVSQSTQSGSTSLEEASNTTTSPSASKEIDDSIFTD